jgi:ABC-type antimicrobial peptide transport system permease subunit
VMRKLDASLPLGDVKTMATQIRENVTQDRIISTLSVAFAFLATVLAAIGLYGVLAYTVAQRTREFGLRMALGADGAVVRGMVMKQVARMAIVGGVIGMLIAIGVGRAAKSLLFEMEGYDPLVLTFSTIALALVALGAGFIPALRASKIDPMNALRYE